MPNFKRNKNRKLLRKEEDRRLKTGERREAEEIL
jgi:hypothetical protein